MNKRFEIFKFQRSTIIFVGTIMYLLFKGENSFGFPDYISRRVRGSFPTVSELRTGLTTPQTRMATLKQLVEFSINHRFALENLIQLLPDLKTILQTGNNQEIFESMRVLYEMATDFRMTKDYSKTKNEVIQLLHQKVTSLTLNPEEIRKFHFDNEERVGELMLAIEELANAQARIEVNKTQTGPILIGGNRELNVEEKNFILKAFNSLPAAGGVPLEHIKLIIFNRPLKDEYRGRVVLIGNQTIIFYMEQLPSEIQQAYFTLFSMVGFGYYELLPQGKRLELERIYEEAKPDPGNFVDNSIPLSAQHNFATAFAYYVMNSLSLLTSNNRFLKHMGELIFEEFLNPKERKGRLFRFWQGNIQTSELISSSQENTPILPQDINTIKWHESPNIPISSEEKARNNFYSLLDDYELFIKTDAEVDKFGLVHLEHTGHPSTIERVFAQDLYSLYARLYSIYRNAISPFDTPSPPYEGQVEDFSYSDEVGKLHKHLRSVLIQLGKQIGLDEDGVWAHIMDIAERFKQPFSLDTLPAHVITVRIETTTLPLEIVFKLGSVVKLGDHLEEFEEIMRQYPEIVKLFSTTIEYWWDTCTVGGCTAPHTPSRQSIPDNYYISVEIKNITRKIGIPPQFQSISWEEVARKIVNKMRELGLY
ncbi:MAG: hypothetical protein NC834_00040 [Candidatus Omnitrophica bacterium]|nr:hypothetical protein [Candidatus Omnitrophota bacterium]